MSQDDAILCRLRIARWRAQETQATFDCLEAAQRKDKVGHAAAQEWAAICALRIDAWKEEAERV